MPLHGSGVPDSAMGAAFHKLSAELRSTPSRVSPALCDRASAELRAQLRASGAEPCLATLRRAFGGEAALALRLVEIVEAETARSDGRPEGAVELLAVVAGLPEEDPIAWLLPRLLGCLLTAMETAGREGSEALRRRLLPLHGLLLREPKRLRETPAAFVALVSPRLVGAGNARPSIHWLYSAGCLAQEIAETVRSMVPDVERCARDVRAMTLMQTAVVQLIHEAAMTGRSADVEVVRPPPVGTAEGPAPNGNADGSRSARDVHASPAAAKVSSSDIVTSSTVAMDSPTQQPPLPDWPPRCSGVLTAKRPKEVTAETEEVSKVSSADCSKGDGSLPGDMGTHVIRLYADIYPGGAGSLMRRLGECAESEISQLVASSGCGSTAKPDALARVPTLDASNSSKRIRALVFLMRGLVKMAETAFDADDVARMLVICILKGSQLSTDLRATIRPLVDLALCRSLVHHVASALWVSTTGSSSFPPEGGADGGLLAQMESDTVYAAGCLACEVEDALDDGCEADRASIQTMRTLQWAARLHLQWLRATPPVADQGLRKIAHPAKLGNSGGRGNDRRLLDEPSSSRATASESEDRDVDGAGVEASDSESSAGSADDAGSDLEDFIDCTPEHNSYGLVSSESLQQAVAASSSRGPPKAEPRSLARQVQSFCQSQLIPNWRLHCSDLLKDCRGHAGSSRRSRSKSPAPADRAPVGKRARVSFV